MRRSQAQNWEATERNSQMVDNEPLLPLLREVPGWRLEASMDCMRGMSGVEGGACSKVGARIDSP